MIRVSKLLTRIPARRFKYIAMIFFVTSVFFGLSGCHCKTIPAGVVVAPSQDQLLNAYRKCNVDALLANHIMVIGLGETIRIIVPSDVIFAPYSANLMTNQSGKLDNIAKLIASYQTVMVRIDAYEDNFFPSPVADALTNKQAIVIADYLRRAKMDTRFVLRHGYGQLNPVAANIGGGNCYNRRVEITFRVYPPHPMY